MCFSASASIHPPIPTFSRFLLEIFLNFLFLLFCFAVPPTHLRLIRHLRTYTDKWHPTVNTLCPTIESAGVMSQLRSKQSAKAPPSENFLATGGCFECNTSHVIALGWLKKEKKKMNKSDFWPFHVCHFKIVATHCCFFCRLGQTV